jgi:hypothetical protein
VIERMYEARSCRGEVKVHAQALSCTLDPEQWIRKYEFRNGGMLKDRPIFL